MDCACCGREFTPGRRNQVYCSKRCRDRGYAGSTGKYAKTADLEMRTCLRCGKAFESSGPANRICEECKHTDDWRRGLVEYRMPGA